MDELEYLEKLATETAAESVENYKKHRKVPQSVALAAAKGFGLGLLTQGFGGSLVGSGIMQHSQNELLEAGTRRPQDLVNGTIHKPIAAPWAFLLGGAQGMGIQKHTEEIYDIMRREAERKYGKHRK